MRKQLLLCAAMIALHLGGSGQAKAAQIITYDLSWSGAALGNSAVATGQITLDVTLMNNPGVTSQSSSMFVQAFSITVSGATLGNGTFGFADYNGASNFGGFLLDTGGGTLDFTKQLVGQSTPSGTWGSTSGNFNIFSNGSAPTAPTANGNFELKTAGGDSADVLSLTGFQPETSTVPIPEPATVTMLGVGIAGLAAYRLRRRQQPVCA